MNADAWCNRGISHANERQWDNALADCSKAIELNPKFVLAWRQRGSVQGELGQWDKAVADYSKAIELDPKFAPMWIARGMAYAALDQPDKAQADYAEAIRLSPKDASTHNDLAWLLATHPNRKVRMPGKAIELAKQAVTLAPNEGTFWNTLGIAQFRAGDWKAALAALKKSMELRTGGDGFDWFFLGMVHWQLGEKEEARKWHRQAVQWMEKNKSADEELRHFHAEAAELLGIKSRDAP
jgi:tetratricopeptide (TPR) repeat protein